MLTAIEIIKKELPKYSGLTKSEKEYGLSHLEEWIPKNGILETFIQKFSEKSLNIKPFLQQAGLVS